MSPPQFVSLSWCLRCHSATPPLHRHRLFCQPNGFHCSDFLFSCHAPLCVLVSIFSPLGEPHRPRPKSQDTKTSRRRRSRHADASDIGRTHAPTLRSTSKARQGKADKQARQGPIMDAPKQEPLTLAHCLPNPDSPSCSTLTLSSSHPRLTACLFAACLLA